MGAQILTAESRLNKLTFDPIKWASYDLASMSENVMTNKMQLGCTFYFF